MLSATVRSGLFVVFALLQCACGSSSETDPDGGVGPDVGTDADGSSALCTPNTEEACYTGLTGTEGVGPCTAGLRTCAADGSSWGACAGEVVPVEDVCSNGLDDDCNGAVDDVADVDGDGWTRCDGDCCETTTDCADPARVNPGAVEVYGASGDPLVDDDCDGTVDQAPASCDASLAIADTDPANAARSLDLCAFTTSTGRGPGIVSARYVRANGSSAVPAAQTGLLASFGPNVTPRAGNRMLGLSTGHARTPSDPNPCGAPSCTGLGAGTAPTGFPQDVLGCTPSSSIADDVGLEIQLRAPTNAVGLSFASAFYAFDYPEFVCSSFNDQFVVLVAPQPAGSVSGNVVLGAGNAPISVNSELVTVCSGCPLGTAALSGTGFDVWDTAAATPWMITTVPVTPGQLFTIRFVIWDGGDQSMDSTVLLDNFQWITSGAPVVSTG